MTLIRIVSDPSPRSVNPYGGIRQLITSEIVRPKEWRKSKASGRKLWRCKADVVTHDMPRKFRVLYDQQEVKAVALWKVRRTRGTGRNAAIKRLGIETRKTVRVLGRKVTRLTGIIAGTFQEHVRGCGVCSGGKLSDCAVAVERFL